MLFKKFCVTMMLLFCGVYICRATKIEGEVWRVDELTANEIAAAYDQSAEESLRVVIENEAQKRFSKRNGFRRRVVSANVQVLSFPDGKVVARGSSDQKGWFSIVMPDVSSSMYWVVADFVEIIKDKEIRYFGMASKMPLEKSCYVELYRENLTLQGRCVDKNGNPVAGRQIEVMQFPYSENENLKKVSAMFTVSRQDGYWSCEGLRLPSLNDAAVFMANTNMLRRTCFEDSPLSVRIGIREGIERDLQVKEVEVLTLTASLRTSAERIVYAYERKKGKPYPLKAPIRGFPVSTNNVIYVPDIALP